LSVVTHCSEARLGIPAAFDVPALCDPKGRYRYWAGFDPIAEIQLLVDEGEHVVRSVSAERRCVSS
jgi:hypothetical protein